MELKFKQIIAAQYSPAPNVIDYSLYGLDEEGKIWVFRHSQQGWKKTIMAAAEEEKENGKTQS